MKNEESFIYSTLVSIIAEIVSERKYIMTEDIIEVTLRRTNVFFLNNCMLFHFPCFAKAAINLIEKVSIPNLAINVNILNTTIAKT